MIEGLRDRSFFRFILCQAAVLIFTSPLFARQFSIQGDRVLHEAAQVTAYELQQIVVPRDRRGWFSVSVMLGGEAHRLVLTPYSVRSPRFQLHVQRADGTWGTSHPPAISTYRGYVDGFPDSRVAASIIGDQVTAQIHFATDVWAVQPVLTFLPGAEETLHLSYHSADVLRVPRTCGTPGQLVNKVMAPANAQGSSVGCQSVSIAQIAFDADVEYYNANGSSVAATVADIENILNAVNIIYEQDTAITHEITEIRVHTTEPDPFLSTDPSTLLNEFRAHWNSNHSPASGDFITRDIAHLMTGKDLDGTVIGVAFIDAVCDSLSSGFGYGLSQTNWTANFDSRVTLTAHELGHNWSAQHCDALSNCHIMCSNMGGCLPDNTFFGPDSIAAISSFRDSRPCLDFINPPQTVWTTGLIADWNNLSNWNNGVPTAADAAFVQNGGIAEISTAPAASSCLLIGLDGSSVPSGTVRQLGNTFLAGRISINRTGLYVLQAGSLNVASTISLQNLTGTSDSARFDWLGGSLQTSLFNTGNGELNMGFNFDVMQLLDGTLLGGGFIFALDGLDLWDFGLVNGAVGSLSNGTANVGIMRIGDGATFQLMPNGTLLMDRTLFVGTESSSGTVVQSGGLLDLETSGSVVSDLTIGDFQSATGSYTLVLGEVAVHDDIRVGGVGTGMFHQQGGLVHSDILYVGNVDSFDISPTGHGDYTLDGGTVHPNWLAVGEGSVTGHFTQNAGTVTIDQGGFQMGSLGTLEGTNPGAIYDLTGGVLEVLDQFSGGTAGMMELGFAGSALFRQSGGSLQFPVLLIGDRNTSQYDLSGGQMTGWIIFVGNSGTSIVDSTVNMTNGTVNVSTPPGGINSGRIVFRTGQWNQSGGTVIAEAIEMAWRDNSFGFWDISGGLIQVPTLLIGEPDGFGGSGGFFTLSGPGAVVETEDLIIGSPFGASTGELRLFHAGASLTVSNSLQIGPLGAIQAVPGATIHLTGSTVTNKSQTATDLAGLADVTLIFEGGVGDIDTFEIASEDLGSVGEGFTDNFALGTLQVGGTDVGRVLLVDSFDNQPLSGIPEGLYVKNLNVGPNSQLDLNGLNVYYENLNVDPSGLIILNGGQLIETQAFVTCFGDAVVDGAVNVSDLLKLLATWGNCPVPCTIGQINDPDTCPADLNRNCQVNVSDLLNLLGVWGPCQP